MPDTAPNLGEAALVACEGPLSKERSPPGSQSCIRESSHNFVVLLCLSYEVPSPEAQATWRNHTAFGVCHTGRLRDQNVFLRLDRLSHVSVSSTGSEYGPSQHAGGPCLDSGPMPPSF